MADEKITNQTSIAECKSESGQMSPSISQTSQSSTFFKERFEEYEDFFVFVKEAEKQQIDISEYLAFNHNPSVTVLPAVEQKGDLNIGQYAKELVKITLDKTQ